MSGKVFYFHVRSEDEFGTRLPKGGHTVAIVRDAPLFYDLTSIPKILTLNIGIAKVHPDDLYNKKTGREQAALKLQSVEVYLSSYHKSSNSFDHCEYSGVVNDVEFDIIIKGSFIRHVAIGKIL